MEEKAISKNRISYLLKLWISNIVVAFALATIYANIDDLPNWDVRFETEEQAYAATDFHLDDFIGVILFYLILSIPVLSILNFTLKRLQSSKYSIDKIKSIILIIIATPYIAFSLLFLNADVCLFCFFTIVYNAFWIFHLELNKLEAPVIEELKESDKAIVDNSAIKNSDISSQQISELPQSLPKFPHKIWTIFPQQEDSNVAWFLKLLGYLLLFSYIILLKSNFDIYIHSEDADLYHLNSSESILLLLYERKTPFIIVSILMIIIGIIIGKKKVEDAKQTKIESILNDNRAWIAFVIGSCLILLLFTTLTDLGSPRQQENMPINNIIIYEPPVVANSNDFLSLFQQVNFDSLYICYPTHKKYEGKEITDIYLSYFKESEEQKSFPPMFACFKFNLSNNKTSLIVRRDLLAGYEGEYDPVLDLYVWDNVSQTIEAHEQLTNNSSFYYSYFDQVAWIKDVNNDGRFDVIKRKKGNNYNDLKSKKNNVRRIAFDSLDVFYSREKGFKKKSSLTDTIKFPILNWNP